MLKPSFHFRQDIRARPPVRIRETASLTSPPILLPVAGRDQTGLTRRSQGCGRDRREPGREVTHSMFANFGRVG